MRNFGLSKLAAEDVIEQNTPETTTTDEEKESIITCLSDCMYCQNPEKTCMLNNVTIKMEQDGTFGCGQYSATQQQEQDQELAPNPQENQGAKAPEEEAPDAKAQIGLSKVKKPTPAPAPVEKPRDQPADNKMGLGKIK